MTREERLEEIRKRVETATPGPWIPKHVKTLYGNGEVEHEVRGPDGNVCAIRFRSESSELFGDKQDWDCSFIALAREDVPWLLSEIERLEKSTPPATRGVLGLALADFFHCVPDDGPKK